MEQRYIQRYRLPDRLYCPGAPVVLAAGRVLEDRKLPRLVAQLKFKSIDPRPIAALSITLQCLDDSGVLGSVPFTYKDLSVQRGDVFGQYTAIVLPWEDIRSVRLEALEICFMDGSAWTASVEAVWTELPPFQTLETAVPDPERLALSRRELPGGRYAYVARDGLWYCTCGAVDRDEESRCHRCGRDRALSARYAEPEGLAALLQERREAEARRAAAREQARQEAEAQAAAVKAAVGERAQQLKARFSKKQQEDTAFPSTAPARPVPVPAADTAGDRAVPATPVSGRHAHAGRSKRKILAGIAALAAVVALAAVFLPRLTGGSRELNVSTPGDTGETVTLRVREDEDGICAVTPELVQELVPQTASISFDGVPDMGDDIGPYLINSYQMACLVTSHGEVGAGYDWGSFDADRDSDSPCCLLVFADDPTRLVGHAIGVPQEAEAGIWELEITLCDYDFGSLVEEQIDAFESQRDEVFARRIAPEDISGSGAEWFLPGYNTGRGPTLLDDDPQAYHLWAQYTSQDLDKHVREMDRLPDSLPRSDSWRCFLLLDRDMDLLGYTVMDSTGSGGPAASSGELQSLGTVDLYLEENDRGQVYIDDQVLREVVPEEAFFNFEGYVPDLNGNVEAYLTDSLHMAWLVSSQGRERGGHSSATWNFSEGGLFTLLLYRDFTDLCGYFIGTPEDLGGGRWRLEITLCDYDFTALYEEQAAGYDAAPQLTEIPESQLEHCGAAWYIEPISQLGGEEDAFSDRVRLQSLWSRTTSPDLRQFVRPMMDLAGAVRQASTDRPLHFMLLDTDLQYIGYVRITDGARVQAMTFDSPSSVDLAAPDTVALDLTASDGRCRLTLEQLQALIPQATRMEFRGTADLGAIEEYLKISDNMAWLAAYGETLEQTSGQFSVEGGRASFRSLLIFSGPTRLCGYFIGTPENVGGDRWRLEITLYDYDFSELLEQQKQAFAQWEVPPFIAPEQAASSGAKYVLTGFYTSSQDPSDMESDQTMQLYSLWSESQSIGVGRLCQAAADLERLRPQSFGEESAWVYCLLLDDDHQPVAYTILTN